MRTLSDLPTITRQPPPGSANGSARRRCCAASPFVLFGVLPATIMLGLYMLMDAPSLVVQPHADSAAIGRSLASAQAAARVAASAVLMQQRQLLAVPPQAVPAAVVVRSVASSDDGHPMPQAHAKDSDTSDGEAAKAHNLTARAGVGKQAQPAEAHTSKPVSAESENKSVASTSISQSSSSTPSPSSPAAVELPADDAAIAAILAAADQPDAPADMAACLREDGAKMPFTIEDFLEARPARLNMEAVFSSRLPRAPTAVTMIVTATMSRQSMIAGLCESYGSIISLAVYVGVLADNADAAATKANATAAISAEFERLEAARACQLDIMVVSELLADAAAAKLFPINALRNMALLAARTELIMLGDLDLLAGADLAAATADPMHYRELLRLTEGRRMIVIPAFESDSMEAAHKAAAGGKAVAAQMWDGTNFRYFLQGGFDLAHRDTRFEDWVAATDSYALKNTDGSFEPWWIARRSEIPVWDVRYRGYGKNKVQQLQASLQLLSFSYVVHPRAFLVHRPHAASPAKSKFIEDMNWLTPAQKEAAAAAAPSGEFSVFDKTENWFGNQWKAHDKYRALVTPAFARCRAWLAHWDVFGPGGEPVSTVTGLD